MSNHYHHAGAKSGGGHEVGLGNLYAALQLVVQVNGKVPPSPPKKIQQWLEGKIIRKVVLGRLVNIAVS